MFPIRDTIPRERVPVMTWMLILANAAAFLYELRLGPRELEDLVLLCGVVPRRYLDLSWAAEQGFPAMDPWPFVTSMFLHGGWVHVISNLWVLWIFGDNVEDRLGPFGFLLFYLACGLSAGVLHLATNPTSEVPTIGASGAIAGVMGAYLVLFPRARVVTLIPIVFWPLFVELPAVVFLGFWFALQLLSGTAALGSAEAGGVAWWAHVGGFVAGLILLRVFLPVRRRRSSAMPAVLLAVTFLAAGCAPQAKVWRRQLTHEDPFERYLAALALCEDYPGRSGAAIHSVFWGLESGVPLYEAGSLRALEQLERHKLDQLIEFAVVAGEKRPRVRKEVLPMLERAGPEAGFRLLECLQENAWAAHPGVLEQLDELAREDEALARAVREARGPR